MLMENTPFAEGFRSEHGLSIHIETERHRILFDMGQSDGFIANAEKLGIDLAAVDIAVLSHGHYDHGGGLGAFLAVNRQAPVYVSQYAFDPCFSGAERFIGLTPELSGHPRLRFVKEQLALNDGLELLACNERARPFRMDSYGLNTLRHNALIPDDFRHEQYLLIREQDKRVLISGCSHKGILNIMFFPKAMLSLFITDSAIAGLGVGSLRLFFSTYVILPLMILSITLFQAIGQGGKAALLTVLRQVALFIPLCLLLPRIGSLGVQGVFLAPAITDFGVLVMCVFMVRSTFRKMRSQPLARAKS